MPVETMHPKKILVFLPQAAARVIVMKLGERGHGSVAVSTVPEVFDAVRSDGYSFAITTRSEIDLLRNIRSIPVINLEIFFHAAPSGEGHLFTPKRFDGRAFMERIEFLVRPVSARCEHASKTGKPQLDKWLKASECWQVVAPKQEQLFFGGCLLMFWLISAASLTGYVITALFLAVATGRLIRRAVNAFAATLPGRSQLRHYLVLGTSMAFFFLLTVRGCYLAAVIVDTEFRSDPFEIRSNSSQY